MERRTAPPPADGRPLPFGNGGLNKALMPAQVASLSPYNNIEGKKRNGVACALFARATRGLRRPSSDARSRGQPWPPPSNAGERNRGKREGVRPVNSLCSRNTRSRTPLARGHGTSRRTSGLAGGKVARTLGTRQTAPPILRWKQMRSRQYALAERD